MKISPRVTHGLKCVVYIAKANIKECRLIRLNEISKELDISVQYLEQIILQLKKNGLLKGKRGPNGGYKVTREPSKVSVLELYNCFYIGETKDIDTGNKISNLYSKIDNSFNRILKETTLEDLMK